MGRSVIEESEMDAEWNSGAMLEKNQRFQTDAEWHGGVLEDIHLNGIDCEALLVSINENIENIHWKFDEAINNWQPIVIQKHEPMSLFRYITSWILTFVLLISIALIISG